MDTSNTRPACTQQLELFHTGTTMTKLAIDALQGDPEKIRGAARALLVLVRYHAARTLTLVALILVAGCGALSAGNDEEPISDAGTLVEDAGASLDADASTPIVPEVLSRFDCVPAPGGKADQGVEGHGATLQIFLDGSTLYDCYAVDVVPPCRGFVGTPYVYECTTKQLGGAP